MEVRGLEKGARREFVGTNMEIRRAAESRSLSAAALMPLCARE
jgi:hypothetical protein